jgi:hypothetical protein
MTLPLWFKWNVQGQHRLVSAFEPLLSASDFGGPAGCLRASLKWVGTQAPAMEF